MALGTASWSPRLRHGGCQRLARLHYETLGGPAWMALGTASWSPRLRHGGCQRRARLHYETLGGPVWMALGTASWSPRLRHGGCQHRAKSHYEAPREPAWMASGTASWSPRLRCGGCRRRARTPFLGIALGLGCCKRQKRQRCRNTRAFGWPGGECAHLPTCPLPARCAALLSVCQSACLPPRGSAHMANAVKINAVAGT